MDTNEHELRISANFPSSVLCARIVPLNLRDAPSPHPSPPPKGERVSDVSAAALAKAEGRERERVRARKFLWLGLRRAGFIRVHSCSFVVFIRWHHRRHNRRSKVRAFCVRWCP